MALFPQNFQLSKQCLAKIKQYPKFYHVLIQIWANASEKELSIKSEICEEVLMEEQNDNIPMVTVCSINILF